MLFAVWMYPLLAGRVGQQLAVLQKPWEQWRCHLCRQHTPLGYWRASGPPSLSQRTNLDQRLTFEQHWGAEGLSIYFCLQALVQC